MVQSCIHVLPLYIHYMMYEVLLFVLLVITVISIRNLCFCCNQGQFYVVARVHVPPPQIHLLPHIQKLADHSYVISESQNAPKSKFSGVLGELTALLRSPS